MTVPCSCFCIPKADRVSCITSYPYKQFQTLAAGPHIERNPFPGSVVCDAFPYFAPLSWSVTNNTNYLVVQAAGAELTSNVWKAARKTTPNGSIYDDTLTITSKEPGGVVLVREFIHHAITGMPSTVTYTNNYHLDTNWRTVTDDPENPANISAPYSITLNPFGSGIDPDPELLDRYNNFLDKNTLDNPTVNCTISVTAQTGTTWAMGTKYNTMSGKVNAKVEFSGPYRQWRTFGSDIRSYIADGSGEVIDTYDIEMINTRTFEAPTAFNSSHVNYPYIASKFPDLRVMYFSSGGISPGYDYLTGSEENMIALPSPPPGYLWYVYGTGRFYYYGSLRIDFILDGYNGVKAFAMGGDVRIWYNGGYEFGYGNNQTYPQYTRPHDVEWPGDITIDLFDNPNTHSQEIFIQANKPIPDITDTTPGGARQWAEFKLKVIEASVTFNGVSYVVP